MGRKEEVGEPICVRLPDDMVERIDEFRESVGYSFRTEAIRRLLILGLEKAGEKAGKK